MKISESNINDLMVAAFEGGINYWCKRVEIVNPEKYEGLYASEIIAKGGDLILHDIESNDNWTLTKEKLVNAVSKTMKHFRYHNFEDFMEDHDAEIADALVQYALFDEVVFG